MVSHGTRAESSVVSQGVASRGVPSSSLAIGVAGSSTAKGSALRTVGSILDGTKLVLTRRSSYAVRRETRTTELGVNCRRRTVLGHGNARSFRGGCVEVNLKASASREEASWGRHSRVAGGATLPGWCRRATIKQNETRKWRR